MISGLLLVDKPKGMGSHDVVNRVRSILGQKEVGHTGTLDPIASGLMVLLLGEATKLSEFFLTGDKGYEVTALFGRETDTLDVTGQVLRESERAPDMSLLSEWSKTLAGEHHWPVPAYSAVKVAGKKLYQYARGEESVPAPVKPMRFWDIELLNHTDQRASFRLRCSKGSYIRSWVKALGDLSGVGATMEELRRTYSAPFEVESALSLGSLEERGADPEQWGNSYVPLNLVLPHLKAVTVRGRDERLLGHGQIAFDLERRLITEVREAQRLSQPVGVRVFSGENGSLLALLEALPGRGLKIKRVFKTTS